MIAVSDAPCPWLLAEHRRFSFCKGSLVPWCRAVYKADWMERPSLAGAVLPCCSAIYFLNLRGEVLIHRAYRDDVG